MDLDLTRVIVTGASTGIGRVTALRLARRGARVFAAARDERRLEALAAEHPEIVAAPCDVSDEADRCARQARRARRRAREQRRCRLAGSGRGHGLRQGPAAVRRERARSSTSRSGSCRGCSNGAAGTSSTSAPSPATWPPGRDRLLRDEVRGAGFTDGLRREVGRRAGHADRPVRSRPSSWPGSAPESPRPSRARSTTACPRTLWRRRSCARSRGNAYRVTARSPCPESAASAGSARHR